MADIQINVNFDDTRLRRLLQINNDSATKLACHNALKKHCDPYVPMAEGPLSQQAIVTEDGVVYGANGAQPYAHYLYVGEVYGPSWPIIQNGVIVGWRSPKGKGSKHPTGRQINYSKEKHALATSHWNQAMYRDHKDEFDQEIHDIITRSLR